MEQEIKSINDAIGRIQMTIVNNRNEDKDRFSKIEADIKRLDLAITGVANLVKENTVWLGLIDKALKEIRAKQQRVEIKSFWDRFK